MKSNSKIRILLVDDHEMVREGLMVFLSTQSDFEVIGQANSGEKAIESVRNQVPDIVLMDLVMPGMDGIQATFKIKESYPHVEVIALTSYIDDEKVVDAIRAGISGYVMKDVNPLELAYAIRTAASGEIYLIPAAARFLTKKLRPDFLKTKDKGKEIHMITPREIEVLEQIAKGYSNPLIAGNLSISIKTVKVHINNLLRKTQLDSRVQLVLYALFHEYVTLKEIELMASRFSEE
jgi:DNA-binding NarL/FixJ family response regulator